MEAIYNYENYETIKRYLLSDSLFPISSTVDYLPQNTTEFHYMQDGYLFTEFINGAVEPLRDGPRFLYRINSNGYRSDHFEKLSSDFVNILVSGCSYTFGQGVPEEYRWGNLVADQMQKDLRKPTKLHNIGYMGNSTNNIINQVMTFIRTYGAPDYLFIAVPDLGRDVGYCHYENRYKDLNILKYYLQNPKKFKTELNYMKYFNIEDKIYNNIHKLHALEDFCRASGINLIWSAWHKPDRDVYANLDFSNYLDLPRDFYDIVDEHLLNAKEEILKADLENVNNWPYWKKARDNNHPGTRWNYHMSRWILDEVKRRGI